MIDPRDDAPARSTRRLAGAWSAAVTLAALTGALTAEGIARADPGEPGAGPAGGSGAARPTDGGGAAGAPGTPAPDADEAPAPTASEAPAPGASDGAGAPPARSSSPGVEPGVVALAVFPAEVRLDDAAARAPVLVQATLADGTTRDLSASAALALDDAAVAALTPADGLREVVPRADGLREVVPRADGATTLRVRAGGHEREVPVVVRGAGRARPLRFAQDVLPVLTRASCNTGSCHGASRGKDGFHLSLFGYDPAGDWRRIARELPGRRIDASAPDESLLLRKATGAVRHGGGRRLAPGSPQHETLRAWIAAGAPADPVDAPRLVGLELWPPASVLLARPGAPGQRLGVLARWSDGAVRDVTALAALATSDATVALLGGDAAVAPGRRGEAWLTARFGERVVAAQVLVVPDEPGFAFPADEPDDHPIDRLVHEKLRRLRARPAPLADDATFLRRVTLDVTGELPRPEEVEAFLADPAPDKRARRVDALLARPAFVELWTMLWAERLLVRSSTNRVSEKAALAYAGWLEDKLARGVPLDAWVRELLTATGDPFERPAVNFYDGEPDGLKVAENVAQALLGVRLQCAQCHNHPFDRWTQDDYYGFAAFFAQVGRKGGADPRTRIVFDRRAGELKHPVTGANVPPRLLGADAPTRVQGEDRRAVLARWLTAADNPWFARNVANMVWAHLLGEGLVHEPDDARVSNPPSNPALLDALAARLVASGWDVRDLVRLITTSRAYQRASGVAPADGASLAGAVGSARDHARARVRRLRAEVLLDAVARATDAPSALRGLPPGGRAVQLADGAASSPFLDTFGRAPRESPCACEVRTSPDLAQALHLLNGDTIHGKLRQGKVVPRLLRELRDPLAVARALYLRTVSRPPTEAELSRVRALLAGPGKPEDQLEDLLWALLNAPEFLFQH